MENKIITKLPTDLVSFITQNMSKDHFKSRKEMEKYISELNNKENYGEFALRFQEKLEGDWDNQSDDAFTNALCGGRSSCRTGEGAYQARYNASKFSLKEPIQDFIYLNFGDAAPKMHRLTHDLGAFSEIKPGGCYVEFRSPKDPARSKLPLLVSGNREYKQEYGKDVDAILGVNKYLSRILLTYFICPELPAFPVQYVPSRKLKDVSLKDYRLLVGEEKK